MALQCTLQIVLEAKGPAHVQGVLANGLNVKILGDNDFYSQRAKVSTLPTSFKPQCLNEAIHSQLAELGLPAVVSSLSKIEPFAYTGIPIGEVHKTGLGSSAALITSLVASLLVHFSVILPPSLDGPASDGRILAHNAAQFAHCLAQGKIGSGFDVSSAVFGSQIYNRFDPAVLEPIMADHVSVLLVCIYACIHHVQIIDHIRAPVIYHPIVADPREQGMDLSSRAVPAAAADQADAG